MGRFFNSRVLNMPKEEVLAKKRRVVTTINPVLGQSKGFLEEDRKAYNESLQTLSDEDAVRKQAMTDRNVSNENLAPYKVEPRGEFECDCGFVAKSLAGLLAHKRNHKEG